MPKSKAAKTKTKTASGAKATATTGAKSRAPILPPDPVAAAPAPRRRRRRRRSKAAIIGQRVIVDIKRKEREFLRTVSTILTDALGFPVRVSHVKVKEPMSPDMRRASRMTRKQAARAIAESFNAPVVPGSKAARTLDDAIPF